MIEAALRAAARDGVAAIRVTALARELGVSSAAPFRHFADRQALLVAAAERAADQMFEAIVAFASSIQDPAARELARGVAYVTFAATHPGHFALLSRADLLAASPKLKAMTTAYQGALEPLLGPGREGSASPELLHRSAGVLAAQALAYGLANMAAHGLLGDRTEAEIQTIAREVLGVLGER